MMRFVAMLCLVSGCHCAWTDFKVPVEADGSYRIIVGNKTWLRSAPTFVNKDGHRWSIGSDDYPLVWNSTQVELTPSGLWNRTTMVYRFGGSSTEFVAFAFTVSTLGQDVTFETRYISGADDTSIPGESSFNTTIAGFPSFLVAEEDEPLGFLSYGGYMFGDTDKTFGRFTNQTDTINDGMNYGPLALFNKIGHAIVISPSSDFMTSSLWHEGKPGGHVAWGIMGGVNSVPENYTMGVILQYQDTINNAMKTWGRILQNTNYTIARERKRLAEKDVSLRYLGYWTDNGAYYYYHPEDTKTMEDTLIDVKTYADLQHIPYKYVQLDSWWYPKDNETRAVITWTPMSSIFPHGLKYLSEKLGLPIVAHNRYWSTHTPYAKQNNGSYNWIVEKYSSLPNDTTFWQYLLADGKSWGLAVYEQDWLNVQTMAMDELQTSLTLGRDWLLQMGQAAEDQGQTIQYCMAMARHALQTVEIPTVTQARVSDDFLYLRPDQWKIGVTSLFANALGIMPSKDTFWTTSVQPGNPYNKTSMYPVLEAAVASLSRGPVGPSDMIGGTNRSLLMRCCDETGKLLRPSQPALAIDKQIIMKAFNDTDGEIWTTTTLVTTGGHEKQYGILFAADISQSVHVTMHDLAFNELRDGIYFPYNNVSKWKYFNTEKSIDLSGCTKENFCLYYFSPILGNSPVEAILGEVTKWVPMSTDRIVHIVNSATTVVATVTGAPGETVTISFVVHGKLQTTDCKVEAGKPSTDCILYAGTSGYRRSGGAVNNAVPIAVFG